MIEGHKKLLLKQQCQREQRAGEQEKEGEWEQELKYGELRGWDQGQ